MATRKGGGLAASFDPERSSNMRYFDELLNKPRATADVTGEDASEEVPDSRVETETAAVEGDEALPASSVVVAELGVRPSDAPSASPGVHLAATPGADDDGTERGVVDQPASEGREDPAPPAFLPQSLDARTETPRAHRRGKSLPSLPPVRDIPVFLDATYAPRQVYLRVPVEVRNKLRSLKSERRKSGEPLTDGAALEEGLRKFPTDAVELASVFVAFARRRVPVSVAMAPHVRSEVHVWLNEVSDALAVQGVRASVNQLAQLALSLLDD